jgi:hypothetical protein
VCCISTSCNSDLDTVVEKGLDMCILEAMTNVPLSEDTLVPLLSPPELYYIIGLQGSSSIPFYLDFERLDQDTNGFYVEVVCDGDLVSLKLFNVTKSTVYIDPLGVDTIHLKALFSDIRNYTERCRYDHVKDFLKGVIEKGTLVYRGSRIREERKRGYTIYRNIDSLHAVFDERSDLKIIN